MNAQDLKLNEIVDFSEGRLHLHGRRLVVHDIHAFAQLRKDLADMVGLEHTRRILTRFGFYWGQADAAAMTRIFKWDSPLEWLKAGPRMHTIQGVVKAIIKSVEFDQDSGRFEMNVVWRDSGEAEEHLLEIGKSNHPVCWMLVGYASGYATFCLKRNVYFIERKCRATDDRVCMATGKDVESWGSEIEPYLKYFEKSEDIQSKILEFTEELKRKNRELARQRKRVEQLEHMAHGSFAEIRSKSFRATLELAARVARFDSSVLITGESGSGKEVLARHIHSLSPRADRAFVAVNCGALPETLLESELFGHKAGSFTGAIRDRKGLFEEAQKGTILLDEIGDISASMQVKLLRVLQEREIMRVGESKTRKIDVRVMAATNQDLPTAMHEGKFRDDLFYRLSVIEIAVPPLRQRKEDILSLARYFVETLAKKLKMPSLRLDATCIDYFLEYSWPGNVRELENILERAAVLSENEVIVPESLPPIIVHSETRRKSSGELLTHSLAQVEQDHIQAVLESTDHNRSRAARILGISPTTLWRKLKEV